MSSNSEVNDNPVENHCYSKVNFRKCNFMWTIEHYEKIRKKMDTSMTSAPFSAIGDNFRWRLHHQHRSFKCEEYISLYVVPAHSYEELRDSFFGPISGEVKISIVNPDKSRTATKQTDFAVKNGYWGYQAGFEKFILLNDFSKDWLSEDKLTIFCELTFVRSKDIVDMSFSMISNRSESSESTLSRDFEKLLSDKHFSDVTLRVHGKNYRTHKGVLAARSSVFKAMFKNNMQESASNHVDITDIDRKTFEKVLQYIYSGKVNDLKESAFELLPAADKYDLEELKSMSEEALSSKLSEDNAIKILMLADMHRADKLKTLTFQFIRSHSIGKNVEDTEIWKIATTSHPHLMKDLINVFLNLH